jgi:hypothetical protein
VTFNGQFNVFIGSNGVPGSVSPALVTLSGRPTFQGADIASGSLSVQGGVFSNYNTSLSFPGGTMISYYFPGLVYDVSAAPDGAALQFGSGPIVLIGDSSFTFDVRRDRTATLVNDFVTSGVGNNTIVMGSFGRSNAVARFYGTLNLKGRLNISILNGKTFWSQGIDSESHEWLGPVILNQSSPLNLMFNLMGNYSSKGLVISGSILDGPGPGTNRLAIQDYAVPFVRLAGNNTYANGTFIGISPSAPQAVVEVAPNSSLGRGDVEVDGGGLLRLRGNQNIVSNRTAIVRGRVILDSGVKVRLSRLRLGTMTFTNGLFTQTNGFGFLVSNGTFRLPATNLLPTVTLISPLSADLLTTGEPLTITAAATDVDSYIQQVNFFLNGALAGARTNGPYQLSITNPPAGTYPLHAIVYDDDGGVSTSAVVNVTLAPRIGRIQSLAPDAAVLDFDSPINRAYELQTSDTLCPSAWMPVTNFPPETVTRQLRVTNALPPGVTTRFYRLVLF